MKRRKAETGAFGAGKLLAGTMVWMLIILLIVMVAGCAGGRARSGGNMAPRVEVGYLKSNISTGGFGMQELYGVILPEDPGHYYNVFRMSGGHIVSIVLIADSNGGNYAGDKLGVYSMSHGITGMRSPIGQYYRNNFEGFYYTVNFSGDTAILQDENGPRAEVSLAKLYRMRVLIPGAGTADMEGTTYRVGSQGGPRGGLLFFSPRAVRAAENPNSDPSDMIPRWVVYVNQRDGVIARRLGDRIPLGDSGYDLLFNEDMGRWNIVK